MTGWGVQKNENSKSIRNPLIAGLDSAFLIMTVAILLGWLSHKLSDNPNVNELIFGGSLFVVTYFWYRWVSESYARTFCPNTFNVQGLWIQPLGSAFWVLIGFVLASRTRIGEGLILYMYKMIGGKESLSEKLQKDAVFAKELVDLIEEEGENRLRTLLRRAEIAQAYSDLPFAMLIREAVLIGLVAVLATMQLYINLKRHACYLRKNVDISKLSQEEIPT